MLFTLANGTISVYVSVCVCVCLLELGWLYSLSLAFNVKAYHGVMASAISIIQTYPLLKGFRRKLLNFLIIWIFFLFHFGCTESVIILQVIA